MTSEIKQRIEQIRRGEVPERYVKTALGLAPTDWKRYTFGDIYTERKEPGDENLPLLMVSLTQIIFQAPKEGLFPLLAIMLTRQ